MELLGIILIFILSPLETFLNIGGVGTISKLIGGIVFYVFFLNIRKKNKIFVPKEGFVLLFFILLGMVSCFWAVYPKVSMGRSITLIQLFILYIITVNLLKDNKSKLANNMYKIFIMFGVAISVYTISQVFIAGSINVWTRASISEDVDVNHLASFLITPFLLGLHYSNSKSIKYLFPTLIISSAILLTQSRGAFLAVVISVGIYLFHSFKRGSIKLRYILIILISIFFIYTVIPKEFFYRIYLMLTDGTVLLGGSGRGIIWSWAWQEFLKSPLVGIGLGNFTTLYRPPHSSFFQIISELGLIGIGLITLFCYHLLNNKGKYRNRSVEIEYIVIIALILMSLTVDIFYEKYLWISFGILSSIKDLRK